MPELPKHFDHKTRESEIYQRWQASGFFNPDKLPGERKTPFTIMMPPPNVTGVLHMGHAMASTIQDILIRYKRMAGFKTLWLPGTDHAAIATQSKVEKELKKTEDKTRHDLGREEFLKRVELFAKESHDTIVAQTKRLGASCDWSREAFTLDEPRSLAVRTLFKMMYDDGLIYRGNRVINWDPKGQTTIADDEIVYEERETMLYTFKYGPECPIEIATTRPETKIGDTAIAVHPEGRWREYIGKTFEIQDFAGVPLSLKVIGDAAVDPEFGTGALGVTPAHSMVDYEMAQRHGLPLKQVINEYAKMNVGMEGVSGKKTTEAREAIVKWLEANGLMVKPAQKIKQNVATAERTGGIIEPLPKLQWFVAVDKPFTRDGRTTTLKQIMRSAVESGAVSIMPDYFNKTYFHWIDNLRDWCISRQIWYGHRIPVWYCAGCGKEKVLPDIKGKWFFVRHGETDWNKENRSLGHSETPLNETGRMQARQAGAQLKGARIDLIISSDLARTKETAEIIASDLGIDKSKIIFDSALRERDYGDVEGMLHTEINEKYGSFFVYDRKAPNGESYADLEERAWAAIKKHKGDHHSKNVLIVSHGGTLRTIMKQIRQYGPEAMLGQPSIKNAQIIQFSVHHECEKCGSDLYEQDPDTLDTWFSSSAWTFSTLGWPEKTKDLATFHPTDVLETGYEILFFWVARMILMTGYALNRVPFKTVYLHGTVRDDKGRKMSKSLGNGIDPIDVANEFGADAGRMALVVGMSPGTDTKISNDKIRGYRNFTTKLWNMGKFLLQFTDGHNGHAQAFDPNAGVTKRDQEVLHELERVKQEVTGYLDEYKLHLAAETIYHYTWHTVADKLIEEYKPRLNSSDVADKMIALETLLKVFSECLKMLHPFMPFVTEELWAVLPHWPGKSELLMVESW